MRNDLSVGMPTPVRLGISTCIGEGLPRLHRARPGKQLVHEGWWEVAHHGSDADEWISADEQHQSRHRAGRSAGHPAHPQVQAVLLLTHHQNLRHRGKCLYWRVRACCGGKLRAVCVRRALMWKTRFFWGLCNVQWLFSIRCLEEAKPIKFVFVKCTGVA